MDIFDQLLCLISARVEEREGSYVVEIPEQELRLGTIREGETYRLAMFPRRKETEAIGEGIESEQERNPPEPLVREGARLKIEIEHSGEQGVGMARIERRFIVIVPDTGIGDRVAIEVTDVWQNVAFADVVERISLYH